MYVINGSHRPPSIPRRSNPSLKEGSPSEGRIHSEGGSPSQHFFLLIKGVVFALWGARVRGGGVGGGSYMASSALWDWPCDRLDGIQGIYKNNWIELNWIERGLFPTTRWRPASRPELCVSLLDQTRRQSLKNWLADASTQKYIEIIFIENATQYGPVFNETCWI